MGVSGGSHEEKHSRAGRECRAGQELARSRLGYRMVHGEGYGGVACATGKGERRHFPAGQGATASRRSCWRCYCAGPGKPALDGGVRAHAEADAWSRLHAPALVGARTRNHVAVRLLSQSCLGRQCRILNHEAGDWPGRRRRLTREVYLRRAAVASLHLAHRPPSSPASHNPRSPFVTVAFLAEATHTEHSSASPQLAVSTHIAGILEVGRSAHTNPRRHRSHLRI